MKRVIIYILINVALLCACSEEDHQDEREIRADILFSYTNSDSYVEWISDKTRAAGDNIPADLPDSLGIWAYNDEDAVTGYDGVGKVFENNKFYFYNKNVCPSELYSTWEYYTESQWPYADVLPWLPGAEYKFFAYAPWREWYYEGTEGTIVEQQNYATMQRVRWNGFPVFSAEDCLYSELIACKYDGASTQGVTIGGTNHNVLPLQMKHLQHRLRFCFRLGAKFGDLRIIRVKSIEVLDVSHHVNLNFEFAEKTAYTYTTTLTATLASGDNQSSLKLKNEKKTDHTRIDYVELSKAYNDSTTIGHTTYNSSLPKFQPLASLYVFPYEEQMQTVKIKVIYDIYDTKTEMVGDVKTLVPDHLLRKDDHAENTINLNLLKDPGEANRTTGGKYIIAGHYRDINITVEPEYLYVLSDNDVPSDGTLVVK